ncbi:Sporulation kinase A [Pirellula sp. SH-Sr6A]|uniref:ATP-binding protein n=1 Tax=Pirellula sp. SH-Sr6A TaxID=1632865 RepID=UPI00078D1613|nr:ATP-binding protein [Pirellula sp. SH-Sr6A]AMV35005.1 Sporulation kinase A [Pirellula sp. SH-Sr6A]
MAVITVVRGVRAGHQFTLQEGAKRIGRDSQCEIHLSDSETSRNHAVIEFREGQYWIRDLGSSNGTFINDQRVSESKLTSGDRIQIGKQMLLFVRKIRRSKILDGEVAIVPPSVEDASQIVGRLFADAPLADQTADWNAEGSSNEILPGPPSPGNDATSRSLWEIMYRTSLAVSRTMDIDQLLHQILELIFQWVQCDRGCIMLLDSDSGELRPSCRKNRRSGISSRMAISKTILEYVTKHGEGVLTSDACEDDRWNPSVSISAGGIREAICVPMKGRYGVVGIIYIDTTTSAGKYASRTDRVFHEEHLKLLVAIGHQAALAIEDTHFYQNMVQAERLAVMGQTIATLSHHIKNIVQGLKGGSYLVDEGVKREDLSTILKGWRICGRNHERIESLVMDMLTMSKDRVPVRQQIDLRELLDDVVELARSAAVDSGTEVAWERPESEIRLMLDSEAIHRGILNLVSNAIDACKEKEGGRVQLALQSDAENVAVLVTDNGIGIPESDLERIFSMFESNKGSRGTGLGLPVSLKIAQEHGGTIHVRSQVGEGTTFEFVLPRNDANAPSSEWPHESRKTISE